MVVFVVSACCALANAQGGLSVVSFGETTSCLPLISRVARVAFFVGSIKSYSLVVGYLDNACSVAVVEVMGFI
jgi:hypothetical protein